MDALSALGHKVRVLTTDSDGPSKRLDVLRDRYISAKDNLEIRYCSTHLYETNSFTLPICLAKDLRWADSVLISGIFSPSVIPTLAMCRMLGRGAIVWPHGSLMRACLAKRSAKKELWLSVLKCLLGRNIVFQAGSLLEADQISSVFSTSETHVIPPGVERPRQIRERPANPDWLRILYLGRLHPIKGIENLIRACAALKESGFSAWSLTLVGSGDPVYSNSLRALVDQLGLQPNVTFRGSIARLALPDVFDNADVTVVPSYSENFCSVVGESLSYGVPVIASIHTPWSQIERVGCGFVVDNSPEQIAATLRLASSADLAGMGKLGAQWIGEQFSWTSCAEKVVALAASLN